MAHRPPATIAVVPATSESNRQRRIEDVLSDLSRHDNLVVLRPGAATNAAAWRVPTAGGWTRPSTPPGPREVVVVLAEGAIGSANWLEELLTVLIDDDVVAAAPMSNAASGDELLVGVPYRAYEAEQRAAFLAAFPDAAAASVRAATLLEGPCVALRTAALDRLGGLEMLAASGMPALVEGVLPGHLAIATRAYLHHLGGRPRATDRPLVSACLIVKDEEANIERCLASLEGVVDEIVCYDSGSTDRTVELAESFGARVIVGHWDGDFARARNASLEHCRGEWILAIDADEALVCPDKAGLRRALLGMGTEVEGFLVTIDNLRGTDTATTLSHPACRLFRRAYGQWDGRIHEQVVARAGTRDLALTLTSRCRLTHWGYVQQAVAERDKSSRNLRTAFGDLAGGSRLDLGERLTSLGRSYLMAGRWDEGLEITREAIAVAGRPSTERLARRALIEALLGSGANEEALEECAVLRAMQQVPTIADAHAGSALLALGRYEEALEYFGRVRSGVDEDGFDFEESFVSAPKAECLAELDRPDEAATVLLDTLRERGGLDAHLGLLADCLTRAGRSLTEIVDAIPMERSRAFVPQLLQLQPEAADAVLEAWVIRQPDNLAVLAAAGQMALRLPIARQIEWSTRLRALGLSASCPLVLSVAETGTDPVTRTLAAAVARRAFDDPRAHQGFVASVLSVADADRPALLSALAQLDPSAAELAASVRPSVLGRPVSAAASGRHVLVVCGESPALSAAQAAVGLARHGHRVTFVLPQPAAPTEALLAPHGVRVCGYAPGEAAEKHALAIVARLVAEAPYEIAVLSGPAADYQEEMHKLLPVAQFVSLAPGPVDLYGTVPATPANARRGIVVVADHPVQVAAAAPHVEAVAYRLPGEPIALIGDQTARDLLAELPELLYLGPLADPTPWVRAARAVLVLPGSDAGAWRAIGELCTTPVVVSDDVEPSLLAELVVEAWARGQILGGTPAGAEHYGNDPLVGIPAPWRRSPAQGRKVLLRGGVYGHDSLATVNRELAIRLDARGVDLTVVTDEISTTSEAARLGHLDIRRQLPATPFDLEIRHGFPPDFRPGQRALVLIQPWEFGGLPAEWIGPMRDVVDELWVPSNYVRDAALASGLEPEIVHVVPNGVDVNRFNPLGEARKLRTGKAVKLLFVGGLIERKGVDALLEAYLSTFTRDDDVCLVIKPFGSDSVYRNSTLEPDVRRLAAGDGPEIEIIEGDLSSLEMAELYRACDALVHPYRGEGFGLPIAEAMACGLPVVVPDGGACLDFCDDEVAWMIPAREVPITPSEWTVSVGGAAWLEPSRSGLSRALREVVADSDLRRQRGTAAAARIANRLTWDDAAEAATARIEALLGQSEDRRLVGAGRLA